MLSRDIIFLISTTSGDNDIGDPLSTPTSRQVFANKKPIKQFEFYQAGANGIQPEYMFEIRFIEYNGEQRLQYNSKTYKIIRTFSKNDEMIELVCTGLVNGVT